MNLVNIGLGIVFIGILAVIIGSLSAAKSGEAKYSVVGFFGFIPFGFSNDKRLLLLSIVLTAIFFIFILFSIKR